MVRPMLLLEELAEDSRIGDRRFNLFDRRKKRESSPAFRLASRRWILAGGGPDHHFDPDRAKTRLLIRNRVFAAASSPTVQKCEDTATSKNRPRNACILAR